MIFKYNVIRFAFFGLFAVTDSLSISFFSKGKDKTESNFVTANAKLPDTDAFLATFLNITQDQIINVAKKFVFVNSTAINKVKILVYTENGKYTNYSLTDMVPIDPSQDIKIVIHGWQSQGTADWVKNITDSYHKMGIKQTVAIDWSPIADENYFKASGCVEHVGTTVAEYFWRIILQQNKDYLQHIHIIGHSLGAHVSSFFAKYIQKVSGGSKIYRISALDAAAPLFEFPIHLSSDKRIDESDADFVGGYHTNAGFLGFLEPFGNHDYYVSFGGPIQPGCENINIIEAFQCSHGRSHTIYNLTINNDNYLARHCSSPLLMFAKLCENNILSVIGEQNNSTNVNGQYFIYVDRDGNPVYPWEQSGFFADLCDKVRNTTGDIVKFIGKIF